MNKKAQLTALLSNPVVLGIILIIAIAFFASPKLLSIISTFEYAGFTFTDQGNTPQQCNYGSSSSNVDIQGEVLTITASGSNYNTDRKVIADLKGLDEVLVIYDGHASASCSRETGVSGRIYAGIVGSEGGSVTDSRLASVSCGNSGSSDTKTFDFSYWKFRNNFDGTWSAMQFTTVGDIGIKKSTSEIKGTPQLVIGASAGKGCGGSSQSGEGSARINVYSIVGKEDQFAVCKADQLLQDKNQDGKFTSDECIDSNLLILEAEEAIRESYDEKFARLEQELLKKQSGLEQQILTLQSQQKDTEALRIELEETKQRLADVEAKDKAVIGVIEHNEQFKEPSAIKQIWNKVIAWIKGIFS